MKNIFHFGNKFNYDCKFFEINCLRRFCLLVFASLMFICPCNLIAVGESVNVGSGNDGNFTVPSGQTTVFGSSIGAVSTSLISPAQTNITQINVGSTSGFQPGDEVMLYVYQADDATGAAGQYEFFHVTGISGGNLMTLDSMPTNAFDTTQEIVVVQRVPNFSNVTINGTLAATNFNGTSGGLIVFRAENTLTIAGTVTASGEGFAGGGGNESGQSFSLDGTGGGGSGNWEFGGGGGSLDQDLTFQHLFLGSGGGGGTDSGGAGGGMVFAAATAIVMTGQIDVSGASGQTYGGGGGSGGLVWLQCWDATGIAPQSVQGIDLNGGSGGGAGMVGPYYRGPGASGGTGYCRLDYNLGTPNLAGANTNPIVCGISSNSTPPEILIQPQAELVYAGQTATFNVVAAGAGPLNYSWLINGTNIPGASFATLTISNVTQADLGCYSVIVSNSLGIATSLCAELEMFPTIIKPFIGATAYWGENLTLKVLAWGSNPLSYQWYDNGTPIPGATNCALVFSSIQFTNAGNYSVIVSNSFGSATNGPAALTVTSALYTIGFSPNLTITGTVGYSYIIQRTQNLADSNGWVTAGSITLTQPVQLWVDTNLDTITPCSSQYFYRVLPDP